MLETNKIVESYIEYVHGIISKYNESSSLIYANEIRPQEINKALASYIEISSVLLEEYQRQKINFFNIQKQYNEWWDDKFIICRKQLTSETDNKSLKVSVKEIETTIRTQYKDEYSGWQDNITEGEYKVAFMRRVLDNFKKFDNILVCLSNNLRQEMKSLNLESRVNYNQDDVRRRVPLQTN